MWRWDPRITDSFVLPAASCRGLVSRVAHALSPLHSVPFPIAPPTLQLQCRAPPPALCSPHPEISSVSSDLRTSRVRRRLSKRRRESAGAQQLLDRMRRGRKKRAAAPTGGSGCSIEALPDGILEHILGFLPAPESVRTCVLARRWRHLWRFATGLRVGCRDEDDYLTPVNERREFMEYVLLGGESPLDTCELKLGEFQHEDVPRVNLWLRRAVARKVQVFMLHVIPEKSPTTLCLELDDLTLTSQHLTRLELTWVQLGNSFLNFSSCPSLEKLVLQYSNFESATKISSESLKHLAIISCCISASASEHSRFRIHAPHLVFLHIDDLEGRTPILESMPLLDEAFVRMRDDCEDICDKLLDPNCSHCDCEYCTTSGNAGYDNSCVLLEGLSQAKGLELTSPPDVFVFKMDLRQCPTFSKLKILILNEYWCMPDDFAALTCILEHSPVLEDLTLELFTESYDYEVQMEGRFSVERPPKISEHLNLVEVKCEEVDERVLKVLKFLCTYNIRFSF